MGSFHGNCDYLAHSVGTCSRVCLKKSSVRVVSFVAEAVYNAAITAGDWRHALLLAAELFDRGPEPSCLTGNAAAYNVGNAGGTRWTLALELLRWCPQANVETNAVTLGTQARILSLCWEQSIELLQLASSFRPEIITCNTVLSTCQKNEEWRRCFALLQAMRGLPLLCTSTSPRLQSNFVLKKWFK